MTKNKETYNPLDNDIKDQAPTLFSIEKQNPFEIPDGYFDELPNIIQSKIAEKKTVSLWKNAHAIIRKPQYSIAASFIILLLSVAGYFFLFNKSNDETVLISRYAELNNLIEDNRINLDNIEESFFVDALISESNIESNNENFLYINQYIASTNNGSESYELSDITSDDIVNYLSEEDYSTTVLYDL